MAGRRSTSSSWGFRRCGVAAFVQRGRCSPAHYHVQLIADSLRYRARDTQEHLYSRRSYSENALQVRLAPRQQRNESLDRKNIRLAVQETTSEWMSFRLSIQVPVTLSHFPDDWALRDDKSASFCRLGDAYQTFG